MINCLCLGSILTNWKKVLSLTKLNLIITKNQKNMKNLKWIVPALLSGLVCFTSLYAETGIGEAKESSELEQIVLPNPVVTDVVLPSKTASGKQIVWTSDHSSVLSADGLVNLPQETTEVKLTATADGESHTFTVSVNPRDITANKVLEYEFESDDVYTVDDVRYVKDKSGNGRDAKLLGSAKAEGTLDLTANTASGFSTNGYAIAPEGTLDGLRSYTFFMMVKPEHLNSSPRLYDFGLSAGNSLFGRASGFTAGMKYNDGTTQMVNSGRTLNTGEANYVAFVFDAKTKETKIYLNGSQVASGENIVHEPYEITTIGADTRNYIGRTQWWDSGVASSNIDYCGTMDHFQLYNIALTTEEIRDLQRPYSEPEIIEPYSGETVTEEGAWCWFADPRALHYEDEAAGINMTYVGYIDIHGAIKAMQYDFNKKQQSEVLIRSYFQPDDHDNPTFLVLPDKRVMIFYSRHTDEACFYYRVSQKPGDITSLGEEKVIKTSHNTTYPSPFILSDDPEHIYLCWRGINWHPTIAQLSIPDENDDVTFTWGPYQMVQSTGARPYAKYLSNGKDKLYVTYTTGHPDNENPNFVYFNVVDIKSKTLQDVNGNVLSNIADGPFNVNKTSSYVSTYPSTVVDNPSNQRDWVWQVSEDKNGYPVIAMVRISSGKTSHDYYYAQWTGTSWKKTFLANGGGAFHQTPGLEMCYSAGMAIDPVRPNEVYCSVPVNGVYEIVKYTVGDDGSVISKPYTSNSLKNNVRPYIIPGYNGEEPQVVWMYGEYYDWIVNEIRPLGYCTAIHRGFDFPSETADTENGLVIDETYDKAVEGTATVKDGVLVLTDKTVAELATDKLSTFSISLSPYLYASSFGGTLLSFGDVIYTVNHQTLKPVLTIGDKVYASNNILGNSDSWKYEDRGTGGIWFAPVKFGYFNLTLTYADGVLTTYVNGLIDQKVEVEGLTLDRCKIGGFNGWVEDTRVYNRALNQSEVVELTAVSQKYTLDDELIADAELEYLFVPKVALTDIVLPVKTLSGNTVTWSSSHPDVLSSTGIVTFPDEATDVKLTATVAGKSHDFIVNVQPRDYTKNMILSYTFEPEDVYEDGGKTYVKDMSGKGHDLQVMGSAKVNGVLDLTANTATGFSTNGYGLAPAGILDSLRSYTFFVEVTPSNLNKSPRIYDFGSSSGNSVFGRASALTAGVKYNWQATKMVDSPKSLTIGKSNKVAFVFEAKTKTTRIYLNGVQTVAGTDITQEVYQLAQLTQDKRNYIGRTQWWDTSEAGNNNDYCGTIDNFYMFNVALTADEIKELTEATSVNTMADMSAEGTFSLDRQLIEKGESLTLYINGDESVKGLQVTLLDMNGRVVCQWTPVASPALLDCISVASGTYVVCVTDAQGKRWSSKIMVR